MVTKRTKVLSGVTTLIMLVVLAQLTFASIEGNSPLPSETPLRGGPDTDYDNVPEDGHDKCLNTPPGLEVDENGCSQEQFCRPFGCSSACFEADWKGNEQNSTDPQDCYAIITSIFQDGLKYEPVCVPLVCEDPEDPEEPPVPTEKLLAMIPEGNVTVWLHIGTDSYFVTNLTYVPPIP